MEIMHLLCLCCCYITDCSPNEAKANFLITSDSGIFCGLMSHKMSSDCS